MSEENVEIVRSVYSAWSDGDLDAFLAVCDARVELLTSGAFPDLAPVYRGHDGLRKVVLDVDSTYLTWPRAATRSRRARRKP